MVVGADCCGALIEPGGAGPARPGGAGGLKTSASAMDRFVQRHGLSFKNPAAADQDRPDVAQAREAWKANQANRPARRAKTRSTLESTS